ncbi:ATP-dependent helicase [candidate division KSB1 bacterium]|nr:ATP-dependent helicase [candidate division KSB1 bacterium]
MVRLQPAVELLPAVERLLRDAQLANQFAYRHPHLRLLEHRHDLLDKLHEYDLVVTTYHTLRIDVADFIKAKFDYVILDEAQAIKNPKAQSAKAVRLLTARRRLALTGTPVENRLADLWSIFDFLNPGMLGTVNAFREAFDSGDDGEAGRSERLRRAIRPFLLRRTKAAVAPELPEKTEETLYCEMTASQAKRYAELREYYRAAVFGKVAEMGLARAKIHVLEALLRLRQAACHPALLDSKHKTEDSGKMDALLPMIQEVTDGGHKVLVFSQFTSFLALVRKLLDQRDMTYEYLDGKTRDRKSRIDRFQSDPDCKLFLISLKAGGFGLNLTAADYVFILDPWWNPAVEAQAIDRTHRIGQDKKVFAYRLISKGSVEEKILELQARKRDLAASIITEAASLISELTKEDLEVLLS